MYKLTVEEISKAVNASFTLGDKKKIINGVSTDSREISKGYLFVAIKGERFDGHNFIQQAVSMGADAVITSEEIQTDKVCIIKVDDTIKAYGMLGSFIRSKFPKPVISVTGSVGKTSTCNMIASAIGCEAKVLVPEKNFNNHIGVPNTLLKLDDSYDYSVLEMGMNDFGEIAYLSELAEPNIAVITNIGISHIGQLKSKQNILKAKLEIIQGMDRKKGLLLLNGDDGLLRGVKGLLDIRHIYFGTEEGNDYTAYNIRKYKNGKPGYNIKINNREYEVKLNVPGYHMVYNSLAALAVARELNIPIEKAIEGVLNFSPKQQRMEIKKIGNGVIINDTYNAAPESMEAALSVLSDIAEGRRKVAVLADMLEMGSFSEDAHRQLGISCVEHGVDILICMGEFRKQISEGAVKAGMNVNNIYLCNNHNDLVDLLNIVVKKDDAVLVKGSRAMKMEIGVETIIEMWREGEVSVE